MDTREAGRRGGRARARNLSRKQLAAIGRKGGLAARGRPRRPYRKKKKSKK